MHEFRREEDLLVHEIQFDKGGSLVLEFQDFVHREVMLNGSEQ